ncbi:MAG TPA: lipopolysaccharide biosynthesis protein [Pseudorhodoplanes sp.]|nr:lipopolysaccharide biosynthesis protein [Pseudorhodoplanes sp.]
MAVIEFASTAHGVCTRLLARGRHWLTDRADTALAQRVASTAFLIRVVSAVFAYVAQIALARWMGRFEFGIYAYVWTWVMLIGGAVDLGLASASQRFIPEYAERGAAAHVRGYIYGSRWIVFGVASVVSILCALAIRLLEPKLDDYMIVPLYLACAMLPIFGVMQMQDGIARSYNWMNVALLPSYVVRQMLLIAFVALAYLGGIVVDARLAVAAACLSLWLTGIGQLLLLNRKLNAAHPNRECSYEPGRWISISLPMFVVDSLYLLLLYVDVIVLKQFSSPQDIAVYYAAVKTLALVSFVHFSVGAATAHKYTEYHVAGDREKLTRFLADSIKWTFWPSLAAAALILICGWPLLWLFGESFVSGYKLMFILSIGILARAAIGPGERFLNMLGEQRACMVVAGGAFLVNLVLCLLLIPPYGTTGAAISASCAFLVESALLFIVAKRRLGFHLFAWRGKE